MEKPLFRSLHPARCTLFRVMKSVRGALLAAAVLTIIASATALAASGYSVGLSATSPVASGDSFSVRAHGLVARRALLWVYLDRKRCRSAWDREFARVNNLNYKSGQPYFRNGDGGPPREGFTHAWVSGSFEKSFTAHAGTATGHEYACAYLTTPNKYGGYQISSAHASAGYDVTN